MLYPLGVTTSGPPYGDPDADARVLLQLTSVATTAEQVEWMADRVRSAMVSRQKDGSYARPIIVTGCSVMQRFVDKEEGVAVSSGVYSYVQRYVIELTTLNS
ncbi:hypothetical protein ACFVIM_00545 [Streptomyces sp. NPDC057638]|uniref:hypothetical protein n=1 Tax=Streptomyces sp. NPDC057638 TaxID=3346190 RepID=UPI0036CBF093